MRKFTQLMLTLALLVVGVGEANAQAPRRLIKEVDFSTLGSYTMWKSTSTNAEIDEGKLKIVNAEATADNYTIQYEVASGIALKEHGTYVIRLTLCGDKSGNLVCVLGDWSTTKYDGASFTTEEQSIEVTISNFTETIDNAHILLQSGHFAGTLYVSKVQVYELGGDEPAGIYDLSMTASKWTGGWNASADNDGSGNLVISITGDYGAKGYPLGSVDCKKYNTIVVEFESYTGGWGQMLLKNDVADIVQTFGNMDSPRSIVVSYDNSLNITEFVIQGGTGNPTITVSRVYLANIDNVGNGISFLGDGFIPAENLSYYADDALVGFTVTATGETLDKYLNWGIGKYESAGAGVQVCEFILKNAGDNVYTYMLKDFKPAFEGDENGNGDKGINWIIWGQGTKEGNTFTRKSVKVYPVLERVTVGSAGFATCRFSRPVNVDGVVKAYTAKYADSKIKLTPVTEIPAGVGVIVEATEGEYAVNSIRSAATLSGNELLVSDGTVTGDGSTIYALGKKSDQVGFVKVKSGAIIPIGKVYLVIGGGAARDFIGFDDETTDIQEVGSVDIEITDNAIYNLSGQRVKNAQKGIYIVNGKKVLK